MAGYKIDREREELGEHLRGGRMGLGLIAQQARERITRVTTAIAAS